MSLLNLIVLLVIVGVVMWLINAFIPMEARIKKLLNVAVVIFLVVYLLLVLLPMSGLGDVKIG